MNNLTKTKVGGGKTFKRFLSLFLILLGCATGAWAQDYKLVTSDTELEAGANYIIASMSNGAGYVMRPHSFNTSKANHQAIAATSTDNIIAFADGMAKLTLCGDATSGWQFQEGSNYMSATSTTSKATLKTSTDATDAYAQFTIAINTSAVITCKGKTKYHIIRYNYNNGSPLFSCYTTGQQNVYLYKEVVEEGTKEVKSIAISGTPTTTAYMVGDTPSADGLTVTATYADETTGTVSGSKLAWSFEPAVIAESTTQVTATATYDGTFTANTTFDVTVEKDIANTEETAYTVEEAVALIDANFNLDATVYVKGIISEVGTFNSKYGSLTYNISTDGTTTAQQFICYSGLNIGGAKFTGTGDVEVGAKVVVKGKLKKFNSDYEFDYNNELVSYKVKAAESITISGNATKTEYLAGEVPSAEGFTVTANYSDATSKDVTAQVTWTFNPETLAEGTTTVTATATYNGLTATTNFTATAKAVTQLIFDKTKGAFDKLSSYSSSNTTMNAVTLVDINGASLNGFTTNGGKTATSNGCLQLANTKGKLVSPAFPDFTNGYTVKITYYIGGSSNPTLTSEELKATGKADGTGTMADGTGFSVELTVPTGAAFELTAGNATYISRIEITKNDAPEPTTATITLNAACTDGEMVYGTFSSSKAFKVSNDIIVSEIMVENGELLVKNYASGAIVPANTGVMVSAMGGGDYTVELSDEEGTSVLGTDNMLKPGSEAMSGDCKFYRLTMHGGKTLGFFWGAAEGAAFSIAADKAYLAVPTTMAANIQGFTFSDTETGINGINAAEGKQAIYNLQGQRVSRAVKGIYIVNGKKVIIK